MYNLIGIIAMMATPAAAAVLFGWEMYAYLNGRAVPLTFAIIGGIAGALAMESVGIYAGHVGIEASRRGSRAGIALAVTAMAVYAAFGWYTLPAYGFVFILAGLIYALVAYAQTMARDDVQAQTDADDEKAWKREQYRIAREQKHELALEQIRASTSQHRAEHEPARASTERHECEDCGRSFGTVQALNAHGRHCKGVAVQNGRH